MVKAVKRVLLTLAVVPTTYTASIFPTVWLIANNYVPQPLVEAGDVFYGPLIWYGKSDLFSAEEHRELFENWESLKRWMDSQFGEDDSEEL